MEGTHPFYRLCELLFATSFLLWPNRSNEQFGTKDYFVNQSRVKFRQAQKSDKRWCHKSGINDSENNLYELKTFPGQLRLMWESLCKSRLLCTN